MTTIQNVLQEALQRCITEDITIVLEHPKELGHGDFASPVALQLAKIRGQQPQAIAQELMNQLQEQKEVTNVVEKMEVAGPGFINFFLKPTFFAESLKNITPDFGKSNQLQDQLAVVEYTDANPFKVLHIGHLVNNTIGESLARLTTWAGAETKNVCYQGDVGMHVAKSIWGIMQMGEDSIPKDASLSEQAYYMGQAYAKGATAFEEDESAKEEIKEVNKEVYQKSNPKVTAIFQWGRQVSLDYFEEQYKILGTQHNPEEGKGFNAYFFESEVWPTGVDIVKEYLKRNVFEESEGAVVFRGEEYGLHTRVFINSQGLPTYEAKELGLAKLKHETFPYDLSIVVTGNEINEYFKVLLKVMSFIYPDLANKTKHVGHGMLQLKHGKMSSRTGNVVAAEDLIQQAKDLVAAREGQVQDEEVINAIAVGAIKYSILRQSAGSNIAFDFETSLSFEGDSGPYLQYTRVRCLSVLRKAQEQSLTPSTNLPASWETTEVEKLLYRFPELVSKSLESYSPHYIAHFIHEVAQAYNRWYASTQIIQADDASTPYKLAITQAVGQVLENGLHLLGISTPDIM